MIEIYKLDAYKSLPVIPLEKDSKKFNWFLLDRVENARKKNPT